MRRSRLVRRCESTVLRAALLGLCLVACGGGESPGGRAALDARTTKIEVAEFAGRDADRCVFSAPDLELCAWRLEASDGSWSALAAEVGADGDLDLLCEFPLDGTPRAEGSCLAHPHSVEAASAADGLPPVGAAGSLERRREAERKLGDALSVRALSHLVGDAPERCKTGSTAQTCEWSVAEGRAGYGLLASLVDDAGSGSTVRLRCVLPLDGSARSTDSCEAAWAD
jgi:hypothetical protein